MFLLDKHLESHLEAEKVLVLFGEHVALPDRKPGLR
jgi:hypothetical protein